MREKMKKIRKRAGILIKRMAVLTLIVSMVTPSSYLPAEVEAATGRSGEQDVLQLPVEFIDYRADNLLFEYVMNGQNNSVYTNEFALTDSDIENYVGEGAIRQDDLDTPYTTKLVEPELGPNGLPVYTKAAVDYVARLVKLELNKERDDDNTRDFYVALRDNLYDEDSHEPSVEYSFEDADDGVGDVTKWKSDSDDEGNAIWSKDTEGSNFVASGTKAGSAYCDFDVYENTECTYFVWLHGYSFRVELIGMNGEEEGEVLASDNTPNIVNSGWEGWQSFRIDADTKEYTKVRVKVTSSQYDIGGDDGYKKSKFGGNGYFFVNGNHYRMGSYDESKSKDENGGLKKPSDITTCYDYAYYMLNHYFDSNTMMGNYYDDIFTKLELYKDENSGYNFLANFDTSHGVTEGYNYRNIIYDKDNKVIRNDKDSSDQNQGGFFPLSEQNAGDKVKSDDKAQDDSGESGEVVQKNPFGTLKWKETNYNGGSSQPSITDTSTENQCSVRFDNCNVEWAWGGDSRWMGQAVIGDLNIVEGKKYRISFNIKSSREKRFLLQLRQGYDDSTYTYDETTYVVNGEQFIEKEFVATSNILQIDIAFGMMDGEAAGLLSCEINDVRIDELANGMYEFESAEGTYEFESADGYYSEDDKGNLTKLFRKQSVSGSNK